MSSVPIGLALVSALLLTGCAEPSPRTVRSAKITAVPRITGNGLVEPATIRNLPRSMAPHFAHLRPFGPCHALTDREMRRELHDAKMDMPKHFRLLQVTYSDVLVVEDRFDANAHVPSATFKRLRTIWRFILEEDNRDCGNATEIDVVRPHHATEFARYVH